MTEFHHWSFQAVTHIIEMIGMLNYLKYFPKRKEKPVKYNLAKKWKKIMNISIPMSFTGLFRPKIKVSKSSPSNRNLMIVTPPSHNVNIRI